MPGPSMTQMQSKIYPDAKQITGGSFCSEIAIDFNCHCTASRAAHQRKMGTSMARTWPRS
uniref:Uncharacterized protein n=1 Tax=Oryza glumipatula TaxID=40148 RepID=A0A0E0AFB5_9ORYZ